MATSITIKSQNERKLSATSAFPQEDTSTENTHKISENNPSATKIYEQDSPECNYKSAELERDRGHSLDFDRAVYSLSDRNRYSLDDSSFSPGLQAHVNNWPPKLKPGLSPGPRHVALRYHHDEKYDHHMTKFKDGKKFCFTANCFSNASSQT